MDKEQFKKLFKTSKELQQVLIDNSLNTAEAIAVLFSLAIDIAYIEKYTQEQLLNLLKNMWVGIQQKTPAR